MKKGIETPKDIEALEGIKNLLFRRKLSPGQNIIYRDLEEALGMSKTPIINALVRLEQEGIVVSHKNRGYYVKQLNEDEIRQMYALRERLEGIAIDFAIKNAEKSDLKEWRKFLDKYNAYKTEAYDSMKFKLDLEVHTQIARIGKNQFLTDIVGQFYLSSWIVLDTGYFTSLIPNFKHEHELLFEAISAKKRGEAKRIMRQHYKGALRMALLAAKPI